MEALQLLHTVSLLAGSMVNSSRQAILLLSTSALLSWQQGVAGGLETTMHASKNGGPDLICAQCTYADYTAEQQVQMHRVLHQPVCRTAAACLLIHPSTHG